MKKIISFMTAAAICCGLLLLPGCATTSSGPTIDQATVDQLLANGISDAVSAAVVAAVYAEPTSLSYISAAQVAFKGFASSSDLSPDALVAALGNLPVKELKTPEAQALAALLLTKYRSNYQALLKSSLATAPRAKLIVDAISQGLDDGVVAANVLKPAANQ